MAQIPIGNFGQSVAAPQRAPRTSDAAGAAMQAKAIGDFAGTVSDVANREIAADTRLGIEAYNADAQTAALKARITKQNDLQDAASKLSQQVMDGSVPRDKAAEEWQTRSQDIMHGATDGLDPKYAGHVQAELDGHVQQFGHVINAAVIKRTQEDNRSNVFTLVDQYERLATTNRQKAIDELFPQLDAVGPKAGYGPDDIAKLKQKFREGTAYTQAFGVAKGAQTLGQVREAQKLLASDAFSDISPQKRMELDVFLTGKENALIQKAEHAANAAARAQEARLNRARAEFESAQGRLMTGIPDNDAQLLQTVQALSGTPYLDTYRAQQNQARTLGGFASKSIPEQQREVDALYAERSKTGGSDQINERIRLAEKALGASKAEAQEDNLRAYVRRTPGESVDPIDLTSPQAFIAGIQKRLSLANRASLWSGNPSSVLMSDEAKPFGDMLKTLPVQQRSTAIAAITQKLGPQASAALAQQLQPAKEDAAPQDRALGLAFGYATAKTTYGRYTSELILKGQQALADKTVKIEKGAEFGWQAEIAKQIEGVYPNQQQAEAVKHAAYLITAGMATDGSPDVGRAVRLAVGGSIVDVNGRRIPVQPGVDEGTVRDRLKAITANDLKQQAPDGSVKVGGSNISLDQFVSGLKDAQLIHAGGGRYNVLAGSRIVTNSAGQRISIEVNANAR